MKDIIGGLKWKQAILEGYLLFLIKLNYHILHSIQYLFYFLFSVQIQLYEANSLQPIKIPLIIFSMTLPVTFIKMSQHKSDIFASLLHLACSSPYLFSTPYLVSLSMMYV